MCADCGILNPEAICLESWLDADIWNWCTPNFTTPVSRIVCSVAPRLYEVTKVVTKNLNKVIDGNYYPVDEAAHPMTRTGGAARAPAQILAPNLG